MAYVIKYDDEYLFDPYVGEDTVTDATITATINASSYFDFTITRDHRLYNTVKERSGIVSVYFDSTLLFMGEITSIEEDFYGSKTISCVDPRDQLSNVLLRPYSTVEGEQANLAPSSVDGYFQWLIDQYNDGMINAKFKLDVGVNQGAYLDKNNHIYRENDQFPSVASELEDKILDSLGGYLTLTYPNGSPTLNLYSDVHEANTQIIDFGVNLLDFSKETATSDQYTAIRPVGGTPERGSDESDTEELEPVTLESLGDGVTSVDSDYIKKDDVVYCLSAVNRYGYKEYNWSEGDTLDPQELLEKAVAELKKNVEPKLTIEVSAVDMALFAEGYDHLECGQVARVRSKPHGIDEYLMVSSVDIDLQDPSQTKYTLGQAFDSLTGEQSSYVKSLNSGINSSLDSVAALDQTVKDQAVQIGSVEQVANDAKDTADNAQQAADNAQTSADNAQNTANNAQQAADNAQSTADSALDKAEEVQKTVAQIDSDVAQAKQDAAQAKADAQQAAAKADAASQAAQAAADKADVLEGSITDVTTTVNGVVQDIEEITTSVTGAISTANEALSAASSASQDLEGFKTTVSQTYQLKGDYATNTELDEAIAEEVLNRNSAIEQSASSITSTVSQTYATKTDLAVTDGKAAQAQSAAQQAQTSASNAQSTANAANNTANGVAEDLTDYMETVATTYASKSELEQTSESITATVEANYTELKEFSDEAKEAAQNALDSYKNTVSTTYATKSEVTQTANSIKSEVSDEYVSKDDASATYATKTSVSTVEQTVDSLTSTVSSNYTTLNNKFGSYYTKTEVDQKDSSIKSTVSEVQTTANSALTKATTVEQTAEGLEVRLTQAEKDVDTAQSTANTAKTNAATAQSTANNAAKTATNYLKFDSTGLCVGDMTSGSLGYNTLIKSTGVDIRNGTTTLASFGASQISLGSNSVESNISMCGGTVWLSGQGNLINLASGNASGTKGLFQLGNGQMNINIVNSIISANQAGKISIEANGGLYKTGSYEIFGAKRLYNNTNPATGNITLSESASNFTFLDIFFINNDWYHDCVRVYYPVNKGVVLSNAVFKDEFGTVYIRNKVLTISGTSISVVSDRNGEGQVKANNTCYAEASTSVIRIYSVWGWK